MKENTRAPFDRVVREHGPVVARICRAMLGATADSEDAWSDTFLAALAAYPKLPADAAIGPWLATIAYRKAIDVLRRRREIVTDELPETPSTIGVPGMDDLDLLRAVAALPVKQRACVTAHFLGGLPYAEVAGLVGGSADAARRAASDGISALRIALTEGADE